MRKSRQVFIIDRSFWDQFIIYAAGLRVLFAVQCSASASPLKLLGRVVRSDRVLAGGVLECNLANRRSIAVLQMLFEIKSNPKHPLRGYIAFAICATSACVYYSIVTLWLLIITSLHASSLQNSSAPQVLLLISVSLWDDLYEPVFNGVGLTGFRSRATPNLIILFCLSQFFLFFPFVVWLCVVGVFEMKRCSGSFQTSHCRFVFNNNNNQKDVIPIQNKSSNVHVALQISFNKK